MVSLIWSPTEATPEELRDTERQMSGLANAHRSGSREELLYHHRPSSKLRGEVFLRALYDEIAHDQQGILDNICPPDLGTDTVFSPGSRSAARDGSVKQLAMDQCSSIEIRHN